MKILQIIGQFNSGGAERVVLNLCNKISMRGEDVSICIRKPGTLIPLLKNVNLFIIPRNKLVDGRYLYRLCKLIKSNNIDIIHAHLAGSGLYGLLAAKITGKKFILTLHGNVSSVKGRTIYKFIMKYADKVIAVSQNIYLQFKQKISVDSEKLCIITNGLDLAEFQTNNVTLLKRKELNIKPNIPIIGAIGNIKHVKGYDILIKSFHQVKKAHKDAKLLIAGSALNKKDLKFKNILNEIISGLDLKEDVVFLGTRNDITDILNIIDVFTLPSRSEGTSISLLEAMASRKAIIATYVGGNPYIIKHNVNGLLIPPDDPKSLANAIIRLLNNRTLRDQLGLNARVSVERDFNLDKMADAYMSIYREVAITE